MGIEATLHYGVTFTPRLSIHLCSIRKQIVNTRVLSRHYLLRPYESPRYSGNDRSNRNDASSLDTRR
jgi:hypothetical protein